MVYAVGHNSPVVRHNLRAEAEEEAQRIAKKNCSVAYVLEAVSGYELFPQAFTTQGVMVQDE